MDFKKILNIETVVEPNALAKFKRDASAVIDTLEKEKQLNIKVGFDPNSIKNINSQIMTIETAVKKVERSFDSLGTSFDGVKLAKSTSAAQKAFSSIDITTKDYGTSALEVAGSVKKLNSGLADLTSSAQKQQGMINSNAQVMSKYRTEIGLAEKAVSTLGKTMLWSTANRTFDTMVQGVSDAVNYVYKLDESLNQIQLVSGMTADEVARLAVEANKTAKALGQTTVSYTDAAMLYLQQGKSLVESQQLAEATMVATNITGEKSTKVVELMTSAMNGYNYSADKAMTVLDKFAAVGAATASDFDELATGFSKVAAMANTAEVSFDQLNSMIATVASATREAPETIGTSFKTIFARLQGLKQGQDEDGNPVDMAELGRYAQQIKDATGIEFFNEFGQIREAGELIEDIGNAWGEMSKNTKTIVAEAAAGQRQASRLHALFNSWDEYNSTLEVSQNSTGAALEQNEIRMDSLRAATNRMQAATEELAGTLLDSGMFETSLNGLASMTEGMASLADATGGLVGILGAVGPLMAGIVGTKVLTNTMAKLGPMSKKDPELNNKGKNVGGVNLGAAGSIFNGIRERAGGGETAKAKTAYANELGIETSSVDTKSQEFKDYKKKFSIEAARNEAMNIKDTEELARTLGVPHETASDLQAAFSAYKRKQGDLSNAEDNLTKLASERKSPLVQVSKDDRGIFKAEADLLGFGKNGNENEIASTLYERLTSVNKDGELKYANGSREQLAVVKAFENARKFGGISIDEITNDQFESMIMPDNYIIGEEGGSEGDREMFSEMLNDLDLKRADALEKYEGEIEFLQDSKRAKQAPLNKKLEKQVSELQNTSEMVKASGYKGQTSKDVGAKISELERENTALMSSPSREEIEASRKALERGSLLSPLNKRADAALTTSPMFQAERVNYSDPSQEQLDTILKQEKGRVLKSAPLEKSIAERAFNEVQNSRDNLLKNDTPEGREAHKNTQRDQISEIKKSRAKLFSVGEDVDLSAIRREDVVSEAESEDLTKLRRSTKGGLTRAQNAKPNEADIVDFSNPSEAHLQEILKRAETFDAEKVTSETKKLNILRTQVEDAKKKMSEDMLSMDDAEFTARLEEYGEWIALKSEEIERTIDTLGELGVQVEEFNPMDYVSSTTDAASKTLQNVEDVSEAALTSEEISNKVASNEAQLEELRAAEQLLSEQEKIAARVEKIESEIDQIESDFEDDLENISEPDAFETYDGSENVGIGDMAEEMFQSNLEFEAAQTEVENLRSEVSQLDEASMSVGQTMRNAFSSENIMSTIQMGASIGAATYQVVNMTKAIGESQDGFEATKASLKGLSGIVASIAPSFGPWGLAVSGIAMLAGTMVDKFVDMFDPLERARKKNEEILSIYREQAATLSSQLTQLTGLAKEHSKIQEELAAAGGLTNATEEQKQAYVDLQNQIAELDATTVAYYNSAGDAVLKQNVNLDEQIEKIKEAQFENEKMLVGNRTSFIEEAVLGGSRAEEKIDKLKTQLESLTLQQDKTDAGSKKYYELEEQIANINTSISTLQGELKSAAEIIQSNVVMPTQKANEEFSKLSDSGREMISSFFNSDTILTYISALQESATMAEELGLSLSDLGLDAGGIVESVSNKTGELETKLNNVAIAMNEISSSSAYEDVFDKIDNSNSATQRFIGTIAQMAETTNGAKNAIVQLATQINEFGVATATSSSLASVQKTALQSDVDELEKQYKNYEEQIVEKQKQLNELKTSSKGGIYNASSGQMSYLGTNHEEAVRVESELVDLRNSALEVEEAIVEAKARQNEETSKSIAAQMQLDNAMSKYYMHLASGDDASYNNLAATYEQQYAMGARLMNQSYSTQDGYYGEQDGTLNQGTVPENAPDGEVYKSYDIQVESNLTDFVDGFDDIIDRADNFTTAYESALKDISKDSENYGDKIADAIADAMDTSADSVKDAVGSIQDILQDVDLRDMLANGSDELASDLAEVAELGIEASSQALESTVGAIDEYQSRLGEMYAAMNADNELYWQNVVLANQDEVNLSDFTMGLKMSNYKTYADYKAAQDLWMKEYAVMLQDEETMKVVEGVNSKILAEAQWAMETAGIKANSAQGAEIMASAEESAYVIANLGKIRAEQQALIASGEMQAQAMQNVLNSAKGQSEVYAAVAQVITGKMNETAATVDIAKEMVKLLDAQIAEEAAKATNNTASSTGIDVGSVNLAGWSGSGSVSSSGNLMAGSGVAPSRPSAPSVNSSMPGSNSGSGGGGSDKGSEKTQEDMEWEKDWYHDINILLKKNADAAKKLADIEDRTYGEQRLKNMREQAALTKERMELTQQALDIAKQEAQHYKDKIAAKGVSFNQDGSVSNYNNFIQGKVNAANSIADADAKKAAQDDVKDLIDDIKKYEDVLFGTIKDYEDEIEKARQEVQDKLLEALEYEFELVIKVKQIIIDDNDFLNSFLEGVDKAGDVLDRLIESAGSQMGVLADLGDKFAEISAMDLDPGPKIEKLEELKNDVLDAFNTLKDLNEAMSEAIVDAIDRNVEALEYAFSELEAISAKAESMIELTKLFGHGEDYEAINEMMDVIAKANELQLETMLSSKQELEDLRDSLEEGTDEWKAANDAVLEMDQNIRDMAIETIQLYRDQLTNAFDGIMKELEKAMSGGQTLDKLKESISKVREEQDRYADSIDQTLFKQKMLVKIQADIANTSDPKKQAQLQEFYEKQVETLGEKGSLLESELTRAEMLYDITLAQMTLEDARNNKSIMKLVRDDQGNWSYQYMADMAAVQEAQDALSQKLADLMEFDKQQFNSTQDYIIQKREEYLQNMRELNEMYLNGEFESEAEYQAAMDALTQEFNDTMLQLETDYNDLKFNLNESTLSALLGAYTEFGVESGEEFQKMYEDINNKTSEGLSELESSWEATRNAISENITNPETGINKYLQDYANKVNEIAKLTGYNDLKNSSNGLLQASKDLSNQIDSEKKKHEELTAAMKKEFDQIKELTKSGGAYDQIKKSYEAIRKEIETYIAKLNEAIEKQKELGNSKPTSSGSSSGSSSNSSGSGSSPKFPGDANGNGRPDKGEKVRIKSGVRWYHDSAGMNPSGTAWSDRDLYVVNTSGNAYGIAVGSTSNISSALGWVKQTDIVGFESGGYTGSFGNQGGLDGRNGKLAMLHEKELILNKNDTQNMLEMITVAREAYRTPKNNYDINTSGVSQNVVINADFSGVRNSTEIESAFENILNKAIQYIK